MRTEINTRSRARARIFNKKYLRLSQKGEEVGVRAHLILANRKRIWYDREVRVCRVEMKGRDGEVHTAEFSGNSLFEVADRALQAFGRLWWFDPAVDMMRVQADGQRWTVKRERLKGWRRRKTD